MKNYHEIAERVAATMRKPKGAKALTEDQFMLMAGALAVELDLMRAQARAELIAEIIKGGPEVYKWRTAARTRTGTPGPWHLSTEPFTSVPTDVDQIACYEIPKE